MPLQRVRKERERCKGEIKRNDKSVRVGGIAPAGRMAGVRSNML